MFYSNLHRGENCLAWNMFVVLNLNNGFHAVTYDNKLGIGNNVFMTELSPYACIFLYIINIHHFVNSFIRVFIMYKLVLVVLGQIYVVEHVYVI